MKRVFMLECKLFLRNRITSLGIGIVLLMGIYAIFHGKSVINQQQKNIDKVAITQAKQLEENLHHHADHEVGMMCYYQHYYTCNEPSKWAAFSIGQRDVNAYALKIRMLAIEGQLYDTELTNPITLVTGNLDLSFIFIFLLPLLIITLTFNLLSAEQETGVWLFVASQPIAPKNVLLLKFSVRFLAVFFLVAVLMVLAMWALLLPFDQSLCSVLGLLLLYQTFWFVVVYLMIKRQQNSSINAVSLLSIWLLLVVLIPAFSNVLIANYIPLPEALATTTIQREAYHKKWDSSKKVVMKPFYRQYPQYQKYTIPADKFSYAWYYAMMFSADEAAAESSKKLFQKLEKRQYIVRMLGYFLPSLYLQNQFNSIAKTDLGNHIHYLKSVKIFHRNISEFFYPYIFKMALPKEVDWKKIPKFEP